MTKKDFIEKWQTEYEEAAKHCESSRKFLKELEESKASQTMIDSESQVYNYWCNRETAIYLMLNDFKSIKE